MSDTKVGSDVIAQGPLDLSSRPKGKGSSSGITGMILKNDKPVYDGRPITERAKQR